MMSAAITNAPAPAPASANKFSWSSVAKGKPETLAQIEAKRAAEAEAKRLVEKIENERRKEEELRASLQAQQREKEFAVENTKRKLVEAQRKIAEDKRKAEYLFWNSREGGCWTQVFPTREDIELYREVPKNVNARALDHVNRWLANFPEVQACKTIGELRQAFMTAFMPYLLRDFLGLKDILQYYVDSKFNMPYNTPEEQYCVLQKWVAQEEDDYRRANFDCRIGRHWTMAKNVTFENCLWAMCDKSKTFEMDTVKATTASASEITWGFIQIQGNFKDDRSRIVWQTDLNTYTKVPHLEKKPCKQKIEKEARRDEELDYYDGWY